MQNDMIWPALKFVSFHGSSRGTISGACFLSQVLSLPGGSGAGRKQFGADFHAFFRETCLIRA